MHPSWWICVPLTLLASAGMVAQISSPSTSAPREGTLVIAGVSIDDAVRGTTCAPQDIVVEGGRIATIAPTGTVSAPSGAMRVDGTGRFAIPGLIDVHAHVGEGGIGPQDDTTRARALRQFLRNGVTTIFVPGATGAGDAAFPGLRQRCHSRAIECPGLYGTGSILTAPGSHPVSTIFGMPNDVAPEVPEARSVTVLHPGRDIDALIAAKATAGVDAIKIIVEDGSPPWYPKPRLNDEQIAKVIAAAHARSLPVFAHVSTSRLTRVTVEAGIDGIMHGPVDALPEDVITRVAPHVVCADLLAVRRDPDVGAQAAGVRFLRPCGRGALRNREPHGAVVPGFRCRGRSRCAGVPPARIGEPAPGCCSQAFRSPSAQT